MPLDGDGADEIIVVRSYLYAGSALSVYGVRTEEVVLVSETPAIGMPFRWLNPIGAADLNGDGDLELACVATPHLGDILHIGGLRNGRLITLGQFPAFPIMQSVRDRSHCRLCLTSTATAPSICSCPTPRDER